MCIGTKSFRKYKMDPLQIICTKDATSMFDFLSRFLDHPKKDRLFPDLAREAN